MLFDLIRRNVRGEAEFRLTGSETARFCNLAQGAGILLRRVRPVEGGIVCYVQATQYRVLRPIAKACKVKMRLKSKRGIPFRFRGFRHRIGLAVGVVCFFVLLWFFSSLIWVVRVEGNKTVSSGEILAAMQTVGIAPGRVVPDTSFSFLEQKALLKLPKLSWLAINRTGSTIVINVSERTERTDPIDVKEAWHMVADCDGQVISIETYSGTAKVQTGQAFEKGDLLISAHLQGQLTAKSMRAMGKIMARVEEEYTVTLPVKQVETLPTGDVTHRYRLCVFGHSIPLTPQKNPYSSAWKLEGAQSLNVGDLVLPIRLETTVWRQTDEVGFSNTKQALQMRANLLLAQQMRDRLTRGQLVSMHLTQKLDDTQYTCRAKAVFLLPVGVLQKATDTAAPQTEGVG